MIIYTAMVAFAQEDMKQVIAYSSVSHMGVIVLGTFALNAEGIGGSVFLMLSHGVISGALFMLVGVIYDRRHTKLMSEFGGLAKVMPNYAVIFGIMLMGAVGLPLTMGFVGELLSLVGFFKASPVLTFLAGFTIILGAIYMLNLFRESFFGEVTNEKNKTLKDLNAKELTALIPLAIVVLWLGISLASQVSFAVFGGVLAGSFRWDIHYYINVASRIATLVGMVIVLLLHVLFAQQDILMILLRGVIILLSVFLKINIEMF
jgi:NADH-quinone oxidoreductase subunit M